MLSPLTLIAFTLALVCMVFATPVPSNETVALEKRITHTGRGTWFNVGLGACGHHNVDSDKIVAISLSVFGSGGNCGQYMHITNTANGKNAYGFVADACEGCGANDIDLSPSLFQQLGPLSQGVLKVSWNYQPKGWHP